MDNRLIKILELVESTKIDEVSKETLQTYREKRLKEPLDKRTPKKTTGIQRSYRKLMFKTNQDKQGTFGDNKGYDQGRYMGDSVEEEYVEEGARSEYSANQHLSSIPSNSSAKKFRLIHKKTGSTRGIFNSHAEALKAHGSHPMKSQLTVEEVEGSEGEIDEASIRDAERALSQHAQRKIDHENKYGPMSPSDLVSHEKTRKLLLTKKVSAQRAYNKRVNNESMVARVQGGRKMVSAEAALRHAREIAHKRSPGSKPTMADIAAAHKRLSSGVNESESHKVGDEVWVKHPTQRYKTLTGKIEKIHSNDRMTIKHKDGSSRTYPTQDVSAEFEKVSPNAYSKHLGEKTLTPAELKKREEVAKAIERDHPSIDMGDKMAIATSVAKMVAEDVNESFSVKDPSGKTVAVKYSDGEAKKHAEELTKKTGQKHTVKFVRSATVKEDTDGKDTVRLEIPALIRALEWAHEDAKDDNEIHKFVERLINHEGTVDMEFFSEGVIPSADRKVDKNGRPYPAHQVHVGTNESVNHLPQEAVGKSNKKIAEMLADDLKRVGIKLIKADPFPGQKGVIWSVESSQYPDQVVTLEWSARTPGGRGINKEKNINLSFTLFNKDGTIFEPSRMNKLNSVAAITFDGIGKIYKERVL